jgi:hypothetical protein
VVPTVVNPIVSDRFVTDEYFAAAAQHEEYDLPIINAFAASSSRVVESEVGTFGDMLDLHLELAQLLADEPSFPELSSPSKKKSKGIANTVRDLPKLPTVPASPKRKKPAVVAVVKNQAQVGFICAGVAAVLKRKDDTGDDSQRAAIEWVKANVAEYKSVGRESFRRWIDLLKNYGLTTAEEVRTLSEGDDKNKDFFKFVKDKK